MKVIEQLNHIGYERSRRATSALALSVLGTFYLLLALVLSANGAPEWVPAFVALAAVYGVAFMGVAAEWFWGRWFAAGLGWSGFTIAVVSLVMGGQWNPILGLYGALHGLVVLLLAGKKMAERYDQQPAWRERYAMDEFGVARLRKTVTRASASLPSVILWALGPKTPEEGALALAVGLVGAGLAVGGLRGVLRLRTWGVVSLAGAAALFATLFASVGWMSVPPLARTLSAPVPFLTIALLAAATLPFAGPILRRLRA